MPKLIRRRRDRSREEIAAILTAYHRSGQSAVSFAQSNQLLKDCKSPENLLGPA